MCNMDGALSVSFQDLCSSVFQGEPHVGGGYK